MPFLRKQSLGKFICYREIKSDKMSYQDGEKCFEGFLISQRAEVYMSILETFDQELYERDFRENATAKVFEQGLKCGLQKALENIVKKCLKKGKDC